MNKVRNQIKEVIRKESYIQVLGCFTAVFILSSLGFLLSCSNRPCNTDDDCTPEQPICVPLEADPTHGVCKCITNVDCPSELPQCDSGRCTSFPCDIDSDCDDFTHERICIDGQCREPNNIPCNTDVDCSPGEICVNNECVPQPPPPMQCGDTFPICNGACPPGEACLFGSAGCMCVPGPISLAAVQATSSISTFIYGENPNPSYSLSTNSPGQSPSHKLSFDVTQGELETYMAEVTYSGDPGAFMFNGFGATNTQIGTFGLDVDFDGTNDIVFSIRALDNDTAYVDVSLDGAFTSGVDPTIEYMTGSHIFTTILPFGGDGNPNTLEALLSARVTLMLFAGILTNPNTPRKYTLTGDFTSVDPDTDDADNKMDNPPLTFSANLMVKITDIEVQIDIKPGGNPNSINLKSKGLIPVAILTTATFDATTVNPMSVKFGSNGSMETHGKGHLEDVDGDGDTDMVLHFRTQSTGIAAGDTDACLIGVTMASDSILGCDSINTVP